MPPGARCARHPDLPAQAVCVRCGNFMCGPCSLDGRSPDCGACRRRAGIGRFPFDRESYTFDGLLNLCFSRFGQHWVTLCTASLIYWGVPYLIGAVIAFPIMLASMGAAGDRATFLVDDAPLGLSILIQIGQLLQLLVQLWLQLGFAAIALDVLQGKEPALSRLFSQLRAVPGLLLQFVIGFGLSVLYLGAVAGAYWASGQPDDAAGLGLIGLGALVGLVPIAYVSLPFPFAMLELVHHPGIGGIGALRNAWKIVNGARWPTLGMLLLGLIFLLLGFTLCCVGALPATPLAAMLVVGLYLALTTPPGQAGPPAPEPPV
ncbi:MAG: hypothetical protein PVI30_05545 [Myxococcales bacterium]